MSRFFECIKCFEVEKYNDNCEPTEEFFAIEKGSKWKLDNHLSYGMSDNHLVNADDTMWIEIDNDYLKKYFKEVKQK